MHRIESVNNTRDNQGRFIFQDGPPGTDVPAAWFNTVQEEIARAIESQGITLKTSGTDTYDQLTQAIQRRDIYDIVVNSQEEFIACFERVAANQYKIKDNIKSLYISYVSGGYACYPGNSFISGGDTWGYIQTNNCKLLFAEPGGSFNFAEYKGHIEINTEGCVLYNIEVLGDSTDTQAVGFSFYLQANNVTYFNCKSKNRGSTAFFSCFRGGTATNNKFSKYIGCRVESCSATGGIEGFGACSNLNNCSINGLTSSGSIYGISYCDYISNIIISNLVSSGSEVVGIYFGNKINNFLIDGLESTGGDVYGIYGDGTLGCFNMSVGSINDLTSSFGNIYGIYKGFNISSVSISNIVDTGGNDIIGISNSKNISCCKLSIFDGSGKIYGMSSCESISNCNLYDFESTGDAVKGITNSIIITGVKCEKFDSTTNGATQTIGIDSCGVVSGAYIIDIQNTGTTNCYGIKSGECVSSCYVATIDVIGAGDAIGISGVFYLSACYVVDVDSTAGTASGFDGCEYGSSLSTGETVNANNDYIDTTDAAITNKFSCHPTNWT